MHKPGPVKSSEWREGMFSSGFTLIELLVVIAIIGILAAMLLPTLSRAKLRAQGVACMNNTRQVMMAWLMYANDNHEVLPPNEDNCNAGQWVSGCEDWNGANFYNWNTKYLMDPRYAKLGPYTKNPGVYHCPADRSTVTYNGKIYNRVRSISMNQAVGTKLYDPTKPPHTIEPVDAQWLAPNFYRYAMLADIVKPSPSMLWIIMDEHPDSINDGGLGVECGQTGPDARIVDFPASFHAGGAGIAYADGHSEVHVWKDPRTKPPVRYISMGSLNVPSPNNPDVAWLQVRTSAQKN